MKINLVPSEIKKHKNAQKLFNMVVVMIVIVFIFTALTYLALSWRLYNENKILVQLEGDNAKLVKTLAEYKEFEKWRNQLTERKNILASAMSGEVRWSFILDEMSMVIPTDIWLQEFKGDASSGIAVNGYTFNHPAVAKWMVRQSDIKKIKNVDLKYSELTELAGVELVSFETTGDLVLDDVKTATEQAAAPTDAIEQNNEAPK